LHISVLNSIAPTLQIHNLVDEKKKTLHETKTDLKRNTKTIRGKPALWNAPQSSASTLIPPHTQAEASQNEKHVSAGFHTPLTTYNRGKVASLVQLFESSVTNSSLITAAI
jgi:hypothetical protein